MAPTHWMTVHPVPAKAAQSIIAPLVDPLAATPTIPLWERTHPPKPGRGNGKGTGEGQAVSFYDYLFTLSNSV